MIDPIPVFSRPVDRAFPITAYYGQEGEHYKWRLDETTGLWSPKPETVLLGNHRGTDWACPLATEVRAMCDGFVVRVRYDNVLNPAQGAGLYILQLVAHPGHDSWMLRYSHLCYAFVAPGDQITRYQIIGESGDTGDVQSPFLHVDLQPVKPKNQWRAIPLEP